MELYPNDPIALTAPRAFSSSCMVYVLHVLIVNFVLNPQMESPMLHSGLECLYWYLMLMVQILVCEAIQPLRPFGASSGMA